MDNEISNEERLEESTAELLKDPDLLDRASQLMTDLGLCGEEQNRRLVFLSGVGGLLGEPIHLIIKGDSSGGKNTLAKTAFRLLPKDTVLATSGLSPQALAYYEDDRIDGVLFIDEAEGLQGAEFSLRQAMSEGRVARLTVGKDDSGSWGGKELSVEVAASIITTTTSTSLHRENQTRVFDLWIDESEEQTRDVLFAHADRAAGGGPSESVDEQVGRFRQALSTLKTGEVVIPFARDLATAFPGKRLRARRDFPRVLSLIRVSALLHQAQRYRAPDGRIVADIRDYGLVYPLLQKVLEASMQGLSDKALALCDLHDELVQKQKGEWLKRKKLENEAGKRGIASRNTVHDVCKALHDLGYWQGERRGPHGAWYHRQLRDPNEEPVVLPRPENLDRPDLPRGPNSRVGRRRTPENRGSDTPPTFTGGERGGESNADEGRVPPSEEENWEASEKPRDRGENSSQRSDGGRLGGGSSSHESGTATIPTDRVRRLAD